MKNLQKITLVDLPKIRPDIQDCFGIELQYKPNASMITTEWNQHVFGDAAVGGGDREVGGFFIGKTHTYLFPEENPPIQSWQIRDYTSEAAKQKLTGMTAYEDYPKHLKVQKAQVDLQKEIVAPNYASAMFSVFLAKLVKVNEMTRNEAIETMCEQLDFGSKAADGLLRRATEHLNNLEKKR